MRIMDAALRQMDATYLSKPVNNLPSEEVDVVETCDIDPSAEVQTTPTQRSPRCEHRRGYRQSREHRAGRTANTAITSLHTASELGGDGGCDCGVWSGSVCG